MNSFFRPSSLLLYFLVFFSVSIVGTMVSGLLGAGDGQGLAGGAIVVGYGVMAGFTALLAAIVLVGKVPVKTIVKINKIFGIVFGLCIVFFAIRIYQINGSTETDEYPPKLQQKTTPVAEPTMRVVNNDYEEEEFSLGFFRPNFSEFPVLYFYPPSTEGKSLDSGVPYDSLTFEKTEFGLFEITYAPPYFFPEYMKMDYDMLLLEMKTLGQDYVEVVVNKVQNRTALVSRFAGRIQLWPTFLLSVSTVHLLPNFPQEIRIKPLDHASSLSNTAYAFLRPEAVRGDWLKVALVQTDMRVIDSGWIRWKSEGGLMIGYSLLM